MSTLKMIAISFSVAVLVTGAAFLWLRHDSGVSPNLSTAYDRVISSGIIRCGYVPYPPGLIKDPNTGKITGVFADAIEEAATNLGLKVQWTEEVGWGSMIEGLNAGRYDLVCSPVWANSTRAKVADFTSPLFYSGIDAYVRTGDTRFSQSLAPANSSGIRISTIDGEMSAIIAAQEFPNAQTVSLPQTADDSQLLLNLVDGKADITFVEPYIADQFLKSHPGSVTNITPNDPVRVFPNTMMLAKGDVRLQSMMDVALSELVNSGEIDRLLAKYAGTGLPFYPDARPYRTQ
jgi:polar amino acid transport system substrate-binding protein